ncbi:MAG: ThuA domain-containing protein [Kiritimatiellae bacterium]|nr:ThuA domain-containing protein [Kiritimatiellia bacterium]MDD4025719.1 ThuA domain-containing protein [Kiritimatiellia bacterium]MDD4622645.1 ThuA domain-containing protein [Kiritimatiellia bacterium]
MRRLTMAAVGVWAMAVTAEAQALKPVPLDDAAKMGGLIGDRLTARPAKPRKALVFWRCEGYVHGEAIKYGNKALETAARQTKAFDAAFSCDYRSLTDKKTLMSYDALVLNNTTHLNTKGHPELGPNLLDFVRAGRGLCVIHAGADGFYECPEVAELIGGLFDGHPWHAKGDWAFKLDEPGHPLNRAFGGRGFKAGDEIYQQKTPPYDRAKLRILVSLDFGDAATAAAKGQKRADNDYAVSWVRPYGKGRVFYTSFAHDKRAYLDRARLWHILDGLQYTLGDLKADDRPGGK